MRWIEIFRFHDSKDEKGIKSLIFGVFLGLLSIQAIILAQSVNSTSEKNLRNMNVYLDFPERVTRGEEFEIRIRIENPNGEKVDLSLELIVPKGFELVSIPETVEIEANTTLEVVAKVRTSLETPLGSSEFEVEVR